MAVSGKSGGNKTVRILCYGSSTTWGYDPRSGSRFPETVRWPCVMKNRLGSGFEVMEEGYSGRTVCDYIPSENPANGIQYLEKLLETVEFDFIIIFLGINDLFADRDVSVKHIASGIEKMIHRVKFTHPGSVTIIVTPPRINGDFEEAYLYQSEIEKSGRLSHEFKHTAASNVSLFVDADKFLKNSPIDGVHLEAQDHVKFGSYMADFIRLSL